VVSFSPLGAFSLIRRPPGRSAMNSMQPHWKRPGRESAICRPTQYATTLLHQTWNRLPRTSWLLRRCLSPSGPQPREYYVDLIRLENTTGIVSTLYDPTHRPYSGPAKSRWKKFDVGTGLGVEAHPSNSKRTRASRQSQPNEIYFYPPFSSFHATCRDSELAALRGLATCAIEKFRRISKTLESVKRP